MKIAGLIAWAKKVLLGNAKRARAPTDRTTLILARVAYALTVAVVISGLFKLNGWI